MRNNASSLLLVVALLLPAKTPGAEAGADAEKYWPGWRGPLATGEAPQADPPVTWGEKTNVRWKVAIPGRSQASPIVWGSLVFVLTAVPTDVNVQAPAKPEVGTPIPERMKDMLVSSTKRQRFVVIAVRRADGAIQWEKTVCETDPHEGIHREGSWASGSPVTDGTRVFAYFGSRGLYCLDFDGNLIWSKDLGDMRIKMTFGEGSSAALCGDAVIVNWDHEKQSFITALSKKSGEELWKVERDEATSWSTPLVVKHGGKTQIIVSATKRVRGYDAANGALLWECGGMTANVIPSPVFADGIVYVTSGFRGNALLAIRLDAAKGDITGSQEAIAWSRNESTPYVPSPLLYEGNLYFLDGNGARLSCLAAKDGRRIFGPENIKGLKDVYASPVGAAGRVYVVGRNGVTAVLKSGPTLEVLATNALDTAIDASPAAVGKELYFRGSKHLYCIAGDSRPLSNMKEDAR